jgi:class 3 adenylate cyclase/tetratricopeptide (TPR) repeat protein
MDRICAQATAHAGTIECVALTADALNLGLDYVLPESVDMARPAGDGPAEKSPTRRNRCQVGDYTRLMAVACPSCGTDNSEGAKFCSECAAPLAPAAAARETRRTVTILFADVSGSTSLGEQLDPESLRALMGRYFAEMRSIIERHGGTVEKFIGDAVMAVFGIPILHEDDALRAVRAAADIGARLAELNAELGAERGIAIRFRTGVNTGEVVAGDPASGQTLVTGDAVNTAARLEQAAIAGEVVIGPLTYQLVRDAVEVERLEPLDLKGKAQPVHAYRLLSVTPGAAGHTRRLDAPLIGRQAELVRLEHAFAEALAERRCGLVTLLGAAGVGKSRLLAEFSGSLVGRARLLTGRCLPYGEGITYWPIAEVVRAAAGIDDDDDRKAASAKLRALAADAPEATVVAERVAQAIGLAGGSAPGEEIFWAVRKLLEALARRHPLVIEFDDIQWADEAFLDLLEHVLTLAHDAPLLLVCPARPELLERRPGWGSGWPQATTLRLEPLDGESAGQLIEQLPGGSALPVALRTRIVEAAEGNPLFVEEMLGMLVDEGHLTEMDGAWRASSELAEIPVPPTISALLAARLDQLAPGERGLAERASVVGQSFEQAALVELLPAGGGAGLSRDLLALVRKELIRPDRAILSPGDAYRFRHLLIRDAAYEALPKAERADLHARFGDWLERVSGDRAEEFEEIIGYHLEQAHRYRTELGLLDPPTAALAERAAARLAAAGGRAVNTSGSDAAIGLLERALTLRPEPSAGRAETLITLGRATSGAGRLAEAKVHLEEALSWAALAADPTVEAMATVQLTSVIWMIRADYTLLEHGPALARAAAVLENARRHWDASRAYRLLAGKHRDVGRHEEAIRFIDLSIAQARLSQDRHLLAQALSPRAWQLTVGPLPAAAVIKAIEPLLREVEASAVARSDVLFVLAEQYGLTGRYDEARAAAVLSRSLELEVGHSLGAAATSQVSAPVERLAGNLDTAEAELRADYAILEQAGEKNYRSTTAGLLAHVLCDRGALADALALTQEAERISAEDDNLSQILWRSARARALAKLDPTAALALAGDAVGRAAGAEIPVVHHGNALLSLAEVHEAASRTVEALDAVKRAIDVFEAKGATAYVELAERRREALQERLPAS